MPELNVTLGPQQAVAMAAAKAEMRTMIEQQSRQLSVPKTAEAVTAFRNVVGHFFPGHLPMDAAIVLVACVAANSVAAVLGEAEASVGMDFAGAAGRREAVLEYMRTVFEQASQSHENIRVRAAMAKNGQSSGVS